MMKKLILFVGLFWSLTLGAQTKQLVDKIVATVGDEYILLSDVEEQFSAAKESRPNLPDNYRCMVLDNIMVSKLLVNQAKIDSLYPKDEEVETQLNSRIERILEYMGGNAQQFIDYYQMTPEQMKETMRDDMRDQIMSDKMRQKVVGDVSVTPAEVREFYSNIPRDSLPYFNQEVEIAEIIMKPKFNEAEKAKARTRLEELRDQIVNGKQDFAALAKKNSQDPGSAREGGDLGWAKRGKFVPEFEAQAYKLEAGEISPVFESEYGYHVLQLIERRGNTIHTRHILIKPEFTDEDYQKARNTLDSVRLQILKDSLPFSLAVKNFGDKNVQSFHNDGRMTNPNSGTTIFETRDLDPDTYFATDTMKVNSISQPIEVTTPAGERVYRIVKLLSKSSPHKANLLQDYNKIAQATTEQKKSTAIVKWIEEKSQTTYVTFDARFKGCPNLEKWSGRKIKP